MAFARDDRKQEPPHFFQGIEPLMDYFIAEYRRCRLVPGHALTDRPQRVLKYSRTVSSGAPRIAFTEICCDRANRGVKLSRNFLGHLVMPKPLGIRPRLRQESARQLINAHTRKRVATI